MTTSCPDYTNISVSCSPCDDQRSGCLGDCGAPVNLENGSVRLSRTYLQTPQGRFQMSWFNLYNVSNAPGNPTRYLGNNWTSASLPFKLDQGDGAIAFLWDPSRNGRVEYFSQNMAGAYTGCFCSYVRMTAWFVEGETVDRLTNSQDGSVSIFDPTTGLITKRIDASGQEIEYFHITDPHRIEEERRTYVDGGNTYIESRLFEYRAGIESDNPNQLEYVTLRRATVANPSSGDWTLVRRVAIEYYVDTDTHGNEGDIKLIKEQIRVGSSWVDDTTEYFRYYTSDSGNGYTHGLKYVLAPEGYEQMASPETATDAQLAEYASAYYEYENGDVNEPDYRRVTKVETHGGDVSFSITWQDNSSGNYGPNFWLRKAVMTSPDGSVKTVFSNNIGQDMLVYLKDGTDEWILYSKYDSDYRLIEQAQPSAIDMSGTPFDQSEDDLDVQLKSSDGRIDLTTYTSAGYVEYTKVQNGSASAAVTISKTEYEKEEIGSGDTLQELYVVSKRIRYQDDSSTTTGLSETSFTNNFYLNTLQLEDVLETLPNIGSSQNGGTWLTGNTRKRQYDEEGRLTTYTDERGTISTYEYDDATGAMTRMNRDAGTGGMDLQTDYEVDDLGRTTQELGPTHDVNGSSIRTAVWTVYKDDDHEVWTGRGYQSGANFTLINPVSISRFDKNGRLVDQIEATRGSGVEDAGKLVESNTFAQSTWTRWSHHEYGDDGQLESTRAYHNIPASGNGSSGLNYDQTSFAYDNMGRQNKVTSPTGTISKSNYNSRNLVESMETGTVDGGGSDNMRTVASNEYDDGADGGDGNLTKVTRQVDGTSGNDRVTNHEYDWRDRLVATAQVESGTREFRSEFTLDNLGRTTVTKQKRDDNGTKTLIGKSETFFDDRGRSYRSRRYAVNDSGSAGNFLEDNTWFDSAGSILKSQPSGSSAFTKNVYDAIGRLTTSYVGYYSGSGGDTPDSVANDVVLTEQQTTFDDASNVTFTTTKQRWHDATGNGALNGPSGAQPKSRDSFDAQWFDGIGRQTETANYGTNGNSGAPTRPTSAPSSSDTILVSETEFNAAGHIEDQTDPAGKVTRSEYDDAGRVTKVTDNHGSTPTEVTETTYNADGNIKTLKASNSNTGNQTTTYSYGVALPDSEFTSNSVLGSITYPDSGTVSYEYNRQQQRIEMTDQNGSVHTYEYDLLGRHIVDKVSTLGTGVNGDVRRVERSFDNRMRIENVTSYDASSGGAVTSDVQYEYNDFGQVTKEYQQHGSAVNTSSSPAVEYDFEDASAGSNTIRAKEMTYPDGTILAYGYGSGANDELSRVETLSKSSTDIASYVYLGLTRVVELTYPQSFPDVVYSLATGSGGDPYAGLDRFGRIVDLQWSRGTTKQVHIKYGYDRANNRLYARDEVARTNNEKFDELFAYDGLHRLDEYDRGELNGTNTAISGSPTLTQDWTLDQTGNWSNFQQGVVDTLNQDRTHNTINEITNITETVGLAWATPAYDNNGNMTTIPQPSALDDSYSAEWDAWNRLVKLTNDADSDKTVAEYEYDGLNRRIIRKTFDSAGTLDETRHVYLSTADQVVEERLGSSSDPKTQFTWGIRFVDDLVLRDRDTNDNGTLNERLYGLHDLRYSIVALTNTSGRVQERFAYQPYGTSEVLSAAYGAQSSSNYDWAYRYTGRKQDLNTDLLYFRARYLVAPIGQFASRDPSGYVDSSSLYSSSFVPNFVDPSGNTMIGLDDWRTLPTGWTYDLFVVLWKCRSSGGSGGGSGGAGGGNGATTTYTPQQCCDWAKEKHPRQIGGLVCCHGVKISCVHVSGGISGATNPIAIDIIDNATKRHEDCHHDHTTMCRTRPPIHRVLFDENTTADEGECICYKVTLAVLVELEHLCGDDRECQRQVQAEQRIVNARITEHCTNAGMPAG